MRMSENGDDVVVCMLARRIMNESAVDDEFFKATTDNYFSTHSL